MGVSELKAKIAKFATQRKHVSFVEIMNLFPEEKGTLRLYHPAYEIVIFWVGMSHNLVAAVGDLLEEKSVHFVPTDPRFTYLADGGGLEFPLATSFRQYKEPHWFPVLIESSGLREVA